MNRAQYTPGDFKKEAMYFLRSCLAEETYTRLFSQSGADDHHYVAARVFLNEREWEQFVWIERYGTLEQFPF